LEPDFGVNILDPGFVIFYLDSDYWEQFIIFACFVQGWKKPGFFKKNQPSGFFGFFLGFLGFFGFFGPDEMVFRVFFSFTILLGASRL
jgi:hypothetical protein